MYCIHCGDYYTFPASHGIGVCVARCQWCTKTYIPGLACTCAAAIGRQPSETLLRVAEARAKETDQLFAAVWDRETVPRIRAVAARANALIERWNDANLVDKLLKDHRWQDYKGYEALLVDDATPRPVADTILYLRRAEKLLAALEDVTVG